MTEPVRTRSPWLRPVALAVTAAWVLFLGYLLLAGDPPDFWFEDIGTVDGPGHVVAGLVTGAVAFGFLAGRPHPVAKALGVTIVFLIGLEIVQDVFTSRGYEASDVLLTLVGAGAGVAAGAVVRELARRRRG